MTCIRHMALWLAATIVLIAVGLMPSGAQAHAGMGHAGQAHAGMGHADQAHAGHARGGAAPLPPAASAQARIGDAEARILLPVAAIRTAVMPTATPVRALSAGACDGACSNAGCRLPSSCCTSAGLTPDSIDAAGPRGPSERTLARALPARTDVIPEAVPEPPRFHA